MPWHDVKSMLREVGLRPTRQRMALGWILFARSDRHLTTEKCFYEEATKAKVPVSLATTCTTRCTSSPTWAATAPGRGRRVQDLFRHQRVGPKPCFFVEGDNELVDIPGTEVILDKSPIAPEGYEVARIDVVVRLKKVEKRR